MTAREILTRYRRAKSGAERRRTVTVLAELNGCAPEDIRELLELCGEVLPPERKKQGGKRPFPREALRAALEAGWSDREIMERLKVSRSTCWRFRREERSREKNEGKERLS